MSVLLARLQVIRRGFAGTFLLLSGSSVAGQAIALAVTPILSRLYGPEDFGTLAVFLAWFGILATAANLRYELAIPLAETTAQAQALLAVCLAASLATGLLLALFLGFAGSGIQALTGLDRLGGLMWFLPVAVAAAGCYSALTYLAIREKAFGLVARTKITQGLAYAVTSIAGGLALPGFTGLLLGNVIRHVAGTGTLARHLLRSDLTSAVRMHARSMAVHHRRFPLILSWAGMLNAASGLLPAFFLTMIHGPEIGGTFLFVQTILGTPVAIAGKAIGQMFMAEASTILRKHNGDLRALVDRYAKRLAIWSALVFGSVALVVPPYFPAIFGNAWSHADEMISVLAIMYLLQFISSPVSSILALLGYSSYQASWDGLRLISVIVCFAFIAQAHSPTLTMIFYVATMSIFYAAHTVLCLIACRRYMAVQDRLLAECVGSNTGHQRIC